MKQKHFTRFAGIVLLCLAATLSQAAAVRYVSVGQQSPLPVTPGHTASYPVTLNRAGLGSMDVYLSVAGLPAGAIASIPSAVNFPEGEPATRLATLEIAVAPGTPSGNYEFTVTGRHGASRATCSGIGILVVTEESIIPPAPVITAIVLQEDNTVKLSGTSGSLKSILIEATFDLANPSWELIGTANADANGLFTFIDADNVLYAARFYRAGIGQN